MTRLLQEAVTSNSKALLLMTLNTDTNTTDDIVEALKFAAKFASSKIRKVSDIRMCNAGVAPY